MPEACDCNIGSSFSFIESHTLDRKLQLEKQHLISSPSSSQMKSSLEVRNQTRSVSRKSALCRLTTFWIRSGVKVIHAEFRITFFLNAYEQSSFGVVRKLG